MTSCKMMSRHLALCRHLALSSRLCVNNVSHFVYWTLNFPNKMSNTCWKISNRRKDARLSIEPQYQDYIRNNNIYYIFEMKQISDWVIFYWRLVGVSIIPPKSRMKFILFLHLCTKFDSPKNNDIAYQTMYVLMLWSNNFRIWPLLANRVWSVV